jgi:hypothetical protein
MAQIAQMTEYDAVQGETEDIDLTPFGTVAIVVECWDSQYVDSFLGPVSRLPDAFEIAPHDACAIVIEMLMADEDYIRLYHRRFDP